jgi:serine/threonine-protein kinase
MSGSSLGADRLGRVAEEFLQRYRRGERPPLTEYSARYPDLAEQIRELFPALVMMEDVRPDPQTAAGAGAPWRLGEYRIVREIGRGGMGVVYEAEQESLGRRVALKVLPVGATAHAKQAERFQREARTAARLHHTNIVPVFAVGEEGGTHFYVMQYIEGRPLDEVLAELRRLRDEAAPRAGAARHRELSAGGETASSADVARSLWTGRFHPPGPGAPADAGAAAPPAGRGEAGAPPSPTPGPSGQAPGTPGSSGLLSDPHRPYATSVAHVGIQAAEALEYAAGQGVLHRDVKPSNLLLDVWGTVWLTDFGLAKASGTPDLTRSGDVLGTLHYMAPERFKGQADVRSDVYSLGVTLYELLALRPAFGASDQEQLLSQILSEEAPRLDRLDPQLPRDLVTVVHKAMAKEPADRYPTAGALAEDLRRFLDDRSIVARRVRLPEQAWRWCRRNPSTAALLSALLALLLLATGGGVWLVRQQAERRAEAMRQKEVLRTEVETSLAQAVSFRNGFHFAEARQVLQSARQRLEPAGPDDLRRRLDQDQTDLDLAEALDGARLQAATYVEGWFDFAGAERLYSAAFAKASLGGEGDDVETVAARVRASPLRQSLVAALDDWAVCATDKGQPTWLLRVARRADPDPAGWGDRVRDPVAWGDGAALAELARTAPVAGQSVPLLLALGQRLQATGSADAPRFLRRVQREHPADFWANLTLANALKYQGPGEAIGYYRVALGIRPGSALGYYNLAEVLRFQGWLDEALDAYRQALRIEPGNVWAHLNRGAVLMEKGRLDEALDHFRQAAHLDPRNMLAHLSLGNALKDRGRLDEALDHFRQAAALDAKNPAPQDGLRSVLMRQGRGEELRAAWQNALEAVPAEHDAWFGYAELCLFLGREDEYRRGRRALLGRFGATTDPTVAERVGRACLLSPASEDELRQAAALSDYAAAAARKPESNYPYFQFARGLAEYRQGRLDSAISLMGSEATGVMRPAPLLVVAMARHRQGHKEEARKTLAAAVLAFDWSAPQADNHDAWIIHVLRREAEALMLSNLPAFLQGAYQPRDNDERVALLGVCQFKDYRLAAARLYAEAFAADPKLAQDLKSESRYRAAACAALAGCGRGEDAAHLGDAERARWRQQARAWLQADLALHAERLASGNPADGTAVERQMQRWLAEAHLAGVRGAEALAKLPPDEREGWAKFWTEVEALRKKAQEMTQ